MTLTRDIRNSNFLIAMLKDDTLRQETFRIVVDGKFHENEHGFVGYEGRERGSLFNVLNALVQTQLSLDKTREIRLTSSDYKKIHALCRDQIPEIRADIVGGVFTKKDKAGYGIRRVTAGGVKDLCEFAAKYPQLKLSISVQTTPYDVEVIPATHKAVATALKKMQSSHGEDYEVHFACEVKTSAEQSEEIVSSILSECNQKLSAATTDDQIIEAIVSCAYELEHLHAFIDVNLRSNIVLMNALLDYYNFPPICFYDPNYLDGCSKAEFFDMVKKGMLQTLDIFEHPGKQYFGFKVSDLGEDAADLYSKITAPLVQKIANIPSSVITQTEIATTRGRVQALKTAPEPVVLIHQAKINKIGILSFLQDYVENIFHSLHSNTSSMFKAPSSVVKEKPAHVPAKRKAIKELSVEDREIISVYIQEFKKLHAMYQDGKLNDTGLMQQIRALGDPNAEILDDTDITFITIAEVVGIPDVVITQLKAMNRRLM